MTIPPDLSPTMRKTLRHMRDQGGKLVRLKGGFWTYPSCPIKPKPYVDSPSIPEWSVGTQTVQALRNRGLVAGVIHHRDGEVSLTQAGQEWLVIRG